MNAQAGSHVGVSAGSGRSCGRLLPPPAPLDMPDQCYRGLARDRRLSPAYDALTLPRLSVIAGALVLTAVFAMSFHAVVAVERMTVLQGVFLVLSTAVFAWMAFGTVSLSAGFFRLAAGRSPDTIELPAADALPVGRTALLFPVYHEDMARVAASIEGMGADIVRHGAAHKFDVFVLSDSRTPEARAREEKAVRRLAGTFAGRLPVFFRWRPENAGRKAGNIRDWVERHGGAYAGFVILDADSLMSAEALIRLARAMEQNPTVGLIQTVPRLLPGTSLLNRLQRLSSTLHGPMAATGAAYWQGGSGNYWGHNAILRTRAFAESAGLADLPGQPPSGGPILSHDFVEAALLRRAGWEVHLVPGLEGTWEGAPPGLGDLLVRDRRWAQGNLQHIRLLRMSGLPWVSRLHLAMGAFAYLAPSIWASTLLVGMVLALQAQFLLPAYFGAERSLFPLWPRFDPHAALPLFAFTMAIVFLPKLLGLVLALGRRGSPRWPPARLLGASVVEVVASMLVAPVLMAAQTKAVIEILARRDSGWPAQRRDGEPLRWTNALHFHRWALATGVILLATSALVSPALMAWMSLVAVGLVLAPLTDWVVSRPPPRRLARVLADPEDDSPSFPAAIERRVAHWRAMLASGSTANEG